MPPPQEKRPQARECVEDSSLPNGDTNDAHPRMSSQPPGTMLANGHQAPENTRPPRPAASRCHTMLSSWGRDPGLKYRFEVFHSGASGLRHGRVIPFAGAPTLLGPPHDLA